MPVVSIFFSLTVAGNTAVLFIENDTCRALLLTQTILGEES